MGSMPLPKVRASAGAGRANRSVVRRWWIAAAAAAGLLSLPMTGAAFTATTVNGTNTWTAAGSFPTYPALVSADGPWAYHRGEEAPSSASTSAAVDSSGNARPGTYNGTTDGPSTWWRFDEGSGTTVADSSGAADQATLHGSPTWVTGTTGTALTFDGNAGYGVGTGPAVHTTGSFSVAAWVRLAAATGSDQSVVSQEGVHSYGFSLGLDSASGKWSFNTANTDTVNPGVKKEYSSQLASVGVWTHLVGVYSASAGKIYLYVDGSVIGNTSRVTPWDATGVLETGRNRRDDTETDYFDGTVDEVRVYNRALSGTEIATLATDPPRVRYPFSEGTGTSTAGSGTVADTATLGSSVTWAGTGGGHTGDAVRFSDDVTNGYVDGSTAAVHTDASFSVAAWVYLDPNAGTTSNRTAVSQPGSAESGFYLQVRSDGNWSFTMPPTDDNLGAWFPDLVESGTPAQLGVWVQLVGVYDSVGQIVQLYVNGVSQGTAKHTSTWDATGALEIGRALFGSGAADAWYGTIDDVRLYQRVLTQADVSALYTGTEPTAALTRNMTAGIIGSLQGLQQGQAATTAVAFAGTAYAYNQTLVSDPLPFTVECWFKATGDLGGSIIGFEASATGFGAENKDRLIFLNNAGRLHFFVFPGNTPQDLVSPLAYNDGAWHHLVGSVGAAGMRLFVDGSLVASNAAVTSAQSFSGYWRWGGTSLLGFGDRPADDDFTGVIDEVAIYSTQLSDTQVSEHFHASH